MNIVFTVLTSKEFLIDVYVSTHSNAKRKPDKWGAVKLPVVTNVDHMVWCTNVLHKSSSQTEFYWKYNHLRGDWYNFFALRKEVCLCSSLPTTAYWKSFIRIHNTASKYTITIEITTHKYILHILIDDLKAVWTV